MPSNVRVAVRVRPMLDHERDKGHKQSILQISSNQITINISDKEEKHFKFDKIITAESSQQQVYEQLQISGLCTKVVEGYHATVFAYGQTGSGKTYSMEGYQYGQKMDGDRAGKVMINSADSGISIRAVHDLFNQSQARKDKTIAISASFLQIYNEKVFDLLNKTTLKAN